MSRYECVLFDLDGTLLDTIVDLANSMNTVLNNLGFPMHEVEAYKFFVGDGIKPLAMRALPKGDHQDNNLVDRCVEEMRKEYGQRWADETKMYPGIPELLDALSTKKIKKVILSNKPHDFTLKVVDKFLSSWDFNAVIGAQDNLPKKPDPAGAMQIASQLGIANEKFIYVGDTSTDMKTATAARMYPVGALWGFRTAEELKKSGAAILIEQPLDLLTYL